VIGIVIERRVANCAHQHCGRGKASLYRISGQRIFRNSQRRATNILVLQLELMSEPVGNSLQDKDCLLSDFGTDPVAGEDCEV